MKKIGFALSLLAFDVYCNKIQKGIILGQSNIGFNAGYYPYVNQPYSMSFYTNIPGILPSIPKIPSIPSIGNAIPSIPSIQSVPNVIPSIPAIQPISNAIPSIPSFPTLQAPTSYYSPQQLPLVFSTTISSSPMLTAPPASLPISPLPCPQDNGAVGGNASTTMTNNAISSSANQLPYY